MRQVTMFDVYPATRPRLWDCMASCANADKVVGKFSTGGKRCDYGIFMNGTGGEDLEKVTDDGVINFICRYYERRRPHE